MFYQCTCRLFMEKLQSGTGKQIDSNKSMENVLYWNRITGYDIILALFSKNSSIAQLLRVKDKHSLEMIKSIEKRLFKLCVGVAFDSKAMNEKPLVEVQQKKYQVIIDYCQMDWIMFASKYFSAGAFTDDEFQRMIAEVCSSSKVSVARLVVLQVYVQRPLGSEQWPEHEQIKCELKTEFCRLMCALLFFLNDPELFDDRTILDVTDQISYQLQDDGTDRITRQDAHEREWVHRNFYKVVAEGASKSCQLPLDFLDPKLFADDKEGDSSLN
ncbi:unnamed protein product [Ambrosiozyma monospora]|uniref:Unnamed protein product n=1 Tax=Ambrosiozyma monospora TaxID=43982 RepID=A0ACB5T9Y2_AMBMO|nr:unnamed protein product [Ambrosiozyma monospora]